MKNLFTLTLVLGAAFSLFAQKKNTIAEKAMIIKTVTDVFEGTDERDWDKVKSAMADKVILNYTSLTGQPEGSISSSDLIESWKKVIPGFDKTKHDLSKFLVVIKDNSARVHYFGKADHFLGEAIWTVEGTYDTSLEKTKDAWHITKQKFTLDKQSGDTSLPSKAAEIAKTR